VILGVAAGGFVFLTPPEIQRNFTIKMQNGCTCILGVSTAEMHQMHWLVGVFFYSTHLKRELFT
jgi:hypothetical protein